MFKVSFKENPNFPVKKVQRFSEDKVTIVILKGVAELPAFLQYFIPPKVFEWVDTLKNVDVSFSMSRMYISVTGKSICSKEDKVDKILGERIAEARAKVILYKFMAKFCAMIITHFKNELYGNDTNLRFENYGDNTVIKAYNKYQNLYEKEVNHLNILLGHEPDTESASQP